MQREGWFPVLNRNGRAPVVVDHEPCAADGDAAAGFAREARRIAESGGDGQRDCWPLREARARVSVVCGAVRPGRIMGRLAAWPREDATTRGRGVNWKLVIVGGIVYYAAQWVVSMASGVFIHEGVLEPYYMQTTAFWRPELFQDPPDMAALMPRWIASGLIASFLAVFAYGWIRPALQGAGWMKGLKFGFIVLLFSTGFMLGWSGVFNLPDAIWGWWWLESVLYFLVGGVVLGWFAERFAPAR